MPPLTIEQAHDHLPGLLAILRELVEFESPTPKKAAVDRAGAFVLAQMAELGAELQRIEQDEVGGSLGWKLGFSTMRNIDDGAH